MQLFKEENFYVASSFIAGFSVMVIELISGRIVAPIIGSSVFTWTSVIGITLLGLAVGSYVGGQISDKTNSTKSLPLSFLFSSILVSIIPILAENTNFITDSSDSISRLNIYLAIYLFLLPTFAIGLIQPMILKKYADNFSLIGSKYGVLSFAWSAGGILGVFLTGFLFISYIGSKETVWLMSLILFLVGGFFALRSKDKNIILFFLTALFIIPIILAIFHQDNISPNVVLQKETDYFLARVIDADIPGHGNSRSLVLDFDFHSIQSEKKTKSYPEMYPVFKYLNKNISEILVIGGGAYTMPKYFKTYYENAQVTTIELDKELVDIGNKFFDLNKYDIPTITGDAKIIINKDEKKYDLIFGDAYNSYISVPWYLLTKEWNAEVKNKLTENGIYAINFIGSLEGGGSDFTNSILNTFKDSFPNFYVFAFGNSRKSIQNIVLVGVRGDLPLSSVDLSKKLSLGENKFLAETVIETSTLPTSNAEMLTNNFSPVEKLMSPIIKSYFPYNLKETKRILAP